MSHPNSTHDLEHVRIADEPYAPTASSDISRRLTELREAERRAVKGRSPAPDDVAWAICSCGGNGWHLGRVGGRICEAGCAGSGISHSVSRSRKDSVDDSK
jgi:hypothetical protein